MNNIRKLYFDKNIILQDWLFHEATKKISQKKTLFFILLIIGFIILIVLNTNKTEKSITQEYLLNIDYELDLGDNVSSTYHIINDTINVYWTIRNGNIQCINNGIKIDLGINELINPDGIAIDHISRFIYCTDIGLKSILRINLDNPSEVEMLVTMDNGIQQPEGIALDLSECKMYWTDGGTKTIHRANLDGTEVEPFIEDLDQPEGIVIDQKEHKLYYTDWGNVVEKKGVFMIDLNNRQVEKLNPDLDLILPDGIAIDPLNKKVYFTDRSSRPKIGQIDLENGNIQVLINSANGLKSPSSVAIDPYKQILYWVESGATGEILSTPVDTLDIDTLDTPNSPVEIALYIKPQNTPVVDIEGSKTVCGDLVHNYSLSPKCNHTYEWLISGGTIIQSAQDNSQINVQWQETGTHSIQIKETNPIGEVDSSFLDVEVLPKPKINGDFQVLSGCTTNYKSATLPNNAQLFWEVIGGRIISSSQGNANIEVMWESGGEQEIKLMHVFPTSSCETRQVIQVIAPLLNINIDKAEPFLCGDEKIRLNLNSPFTTNKFRWFREDKNSFEFIGNGDFYLVERPGEYWAEVVTDCGVLLSDTVLIGGEQIFAPSAFTPNGDSRHDTFFLINPNPQKIRFATLTITDAYGKEFYHYSGTNINQIISRDNSPNIGWDGEYAPQGSYLWYLVVEFEKCGIIKKSGAVLLKR